MIPAWPVAARSTAEARLFAALSACLSDAYVVLQNPRWVEKTDSRVKEFEADFVVAHPEKGLLVLEVKGGAIFFDQGEGSWRSTDRKGTTFPIRDPYVQAQDARHSLRRSLRADASFPGDWGPFGHAVAFPDGLVTSRPQSQGPAEVTLGAAEIRDTAKLRARIDSIFDFWGPQRTGNSGTGALRVLHATLVHDFEVRSLRTSIDDADQEFLTLSQQQYRLLTCMDENPRVAVAGCAGSGKTILAVEKAQRLASQGLRTLLTCFNRPLADHLQRVVGSIPNLKICDFHQLCIGMASKAGLDTARGEQSEKDYYDKRLPDLLLTSIDMLQEPFDAIVVDEGQDFALPWWDPLLLSLRDPQDGIFYVFYDDNQNLYDRPTALPRGIFHYRLAENWRNTERINEVMQQYYDGRPVIAMGPEGITVERKVVATPDELRAELRRTLHRLCRQEGVPCGDVVVLTPQNVARSGLLGKLGPFQVTERPSGADQVQLSSIHRFKGLETMIGIVAGVRQRDADSPELMYVATSRARSHLILISYSEQAGQGRCL
jgi:hypothetical protein